MPNVEKPDFGEIFSAGTRVGGAAGRVRVPNVGKMHATAFRP
jgi:hypothetical protein